MQTNLALLFLCVLCGFLAVVTEITSALEQARLHCREVQVGRAECALSSYGKRCRVKPA